MSKRNLSKRYKKEVAKKALKLKKDHPDLTWSAISERFAGVSSPAHLKSIINSVYKKDN